MIPAHAALPLEKVERVLCAELGHREVDERRAAPVTEFKLCVRCGKIGARL